MKIFLLAMWAIMAYIRRVNKKDGKGREQSIRFSPDLTAKIDAWMTEQDLRSFNTAILMLVKKGITEANWEAAIIARARKKRDAKEIGGPSARPSNPPGADREEAES